MSLIPFPSVPALPGVPALPRSPKFPPAIKSALGLAQSAILRALQIQTRWGIFDKSGKALGDPSKIGGLIGGIIESAGIGSTLSTSVFDYLKETKISDFPIEKGGFANYNKVEMAASPIVTLALSGSENDRRTFLGEIEKATKSTDLYSVVTPEVTYLEYSIERYSYSRRSSKGATLLIVEITLKEIRQVSSQYKQASKTAIDSPKDVGATPSVNNGKLQAKAPEVSTLKSIANKIPSLATNAVSALKGAP